MADRSARLCAATRPTRPLVTDSGVLALAGRCAAAVVLSAGVLCNSPALAAGLEQAGFPAPGTARTAMLVARSPLASTSSLLATPPPLASTAVAAGAAASGSLTVAGVVEEAEELAMDFVHFFQHSVEAVETTVHHLQVAHAMERLENVPLNQVVDMDLLKAALHPSDAGKALLGEAEEGSPLPVSSSSAAAHRQLDAALDSVAEWRLRDVVDVHKLAKALEDVSVSDPLDGRLLSREALRIRRHVHWETVADAVRPQPLRKALSAMAGRSGNPFAELDMRAAVGAVRMDTVRGVLAPPKPAEPEHSHALDSSGMWTWESM